MKFAILAAGEGSRLAAEGVEIPKPLVCIDGESMLGRLLGIFERCGAEEVVVVTNHEACERACRAWAEQHVGCPVRCLLRTTPSSMHSFHELVPLLGSGRFVLTTVDTVFRETEFRAYVERFREAADIDGLMGVTDYVDDEKPLWVATDGNLHITGFHDVQTAEGTADGPCRFVSGGIYGLTDRCFPVLKACIASGQHRMRNFQRAMVAEGLQLQAYPFSKIIDVDHEGDIRKAEAFVQENAVAATYKSMDTEEWWDRVFTRPIGYQWARLFRWLGVHPNTVTVLSMILGALAGVLFYADADTPRGFCLNVCGVLLLMWANFLDSADGQLARMTGQTTPLGRILDGASSDVWFIPIYFFLFLRLFDKVIPGCETQTWGFWGLALMAVAGLGAHTYECQLADYYRNIHLYFIKGASGSEFDHYADQKAKYDAMPWRGHVVEKVFQWFYVNYTHTQELATPQFQRLWRQWRQTYGDEIPVALREQFRRKSLPLMKWTNILTFNTRAAVLYVACLVDEPWIYPVFELTVLLAIYLYMRHQHEAFCKQLRVES